MLKNILYGLRQVPRCWFSKLTGALVNFGFVQSFADYSLFTDIKGYMSLRVLVYVDDLIISCNAMGMLGKFNAYLSKCFNIKDLGKAKYFLSIEVSRGMTRICLSQRKYALDIVAEVGLLGCKLPSTPLEQNHKVLGDTGSIYENHVEFQRLVGRLVYVTITRPDLSYVVHVLSQVMHDPHVAHWDVTVRIVRYIKGCPGQRILLRADSNLRIRAYCGSDWASCPITRRSLFAYVLLLGRSPISWKTKKQDTVSHSSAETEYRAMAASLRELKWLK